MWFGCPYAMGSRSCGDKGLVSGGLPDILGDFGIIFWGAARGSPRNRDP